METNINPSIFRKQNERLSQEEIQMMNPLSLAYIGDGVFELLVRSYLMSGRKQVSTLHKESSYIVKAETQARLIKEVLPILTKEEVTIVRRGRNAHSHTMAKNAKVSDYRLATGLEALFGYLFLKGEEERLNEIFQEMKERF